MFTRRESKLAIKLGPVSSKGGAKGGCYEGMAKINRGQVEKNSSRMDSGLTNRPLYDLQTCSSCLNQTLKC